MTISIKEAIKEQTKILMKERDKIGVETLRGLSTAIQYEELTQKKEPLDDQSAIEVVKRELKKRQEELEFNLQAGRTDTIENLKHEVAALERFLPAQMTKEALLATINEIKSSMPNPNMGLIMKSLKETYNGKYDSKLASEIVKEVLG